MQLEIYHIGIHTVELINMEFQIDSVLKEAITKWLFDSAAKITA